MHISFVNSLLGGDFSALDISITLLATYINERTSHSASIIDLTFHRRHWRKTLQKGIEKNNPDMVAISCNTMYMQYVKVIMDEVKNKYNLPILLGGHHASIYPEDTIKIDACDALIIGDGEDPICQFLDRFEKRESCHGIKGLWYKENGEILKNSNGQFRVDLDNLPIPNWSLWEDLDKYFYHLGMLYMIGSRGCPYRCTYCDAVGISDAVEGKYFRMKSPVLYAREIAEQWRRYKDRGLRLAQLFDPVFTMNHSWVEQFCAEYRNLGIEKEFRFSVFSRIDHLNEHVIKILAKSGCALLRVGVEAGDDFIRNNIYRKKITNEQIREIFTLAKKHGIGFTAYYILGGPCETPKTLQRTIDLAYELDAERSAFFIYKPFTQEGVKQVMEYGGWIDMDRWGKADNITFDAVVYTKELTPRQVERYQKRAYFLTFGRRLFRMLKKQKLKYFFRFFVYMFKGLYSGLSFSYLITYYHIYSYDNVDK